MVETMHPTLQKERLTHALLCPDDWKFILELVNTDGWLQFIGDRKVHTEEDARAYIQKILDGPDYTYWTVRMKDKKNPVGIITWIRRSYLPHYDIGFAFLPAFSKAGYAYEAASAVFNYIKDQGTVTHVSAVTLKENHSSIRLLNKLGLQFKEEMEIENEKLQVYEASVDQWVIAQVTKAFFSAFTNRGNRQPKLELLEEICIPQASFINRKANGTDIMEFASFLEPRKKILTNNSLTGFEEKETAHTTIISGDIALCYAEYEKTGVLSGQPFTIRGHKMFQFVRIGKKWKISSVVWQDEEG